MKVSTEEFLKLVQERPALWQKTHPDFSNRDIRIKLMKQIAVAAETDAAECTKKLKNLKDSMRAQVAKLPKTSSGSPAFSLSDHISWPFFKLMMFMKDEFNGRTMRSSINYKEIVASETPKIEEENTSQCYEPQDLYASSSTPTMIDFQIATSGSGSVPNQSWEGSLNAKKLKRRRPTSSQSDYEELATTDELDVFASDIANDLRKIQSPLKLMQAKSRIRRIAEEFVISELLPSAPVTHTEMSSVTCPSQYQS